MIQNTKRGRIIGEFLIRQFKSSGIFGYKQTPDLELPTEMKKGSREHLRFLTLLAPLSSVRNFEELMRAARKTWEDKDTKFLFYPKRVIKRTNTEVFEAASKHGLSRKRYRETISYFIPFSKSMVYLFDGDPYNLLSRYSFDASVIYEKTRERFSEWFPYMSGKKILPMYLRILSTHGFSFELKHLERIPIPVDVHTSRSTVVLGCISGKFDGSQESFYLQVQRYWSEVCQDTSFIALDVDAPLWTLSKYGCRVRRESYCPKEKFCYFSRFCKPGRYQVEASLLHIEM